VTIGKYGSSNPVAAVVEVNPTNGAFAVKKLTVATDLGTVVNPTA
jgi:CO/xanthine dehydrogenase Mo-binding subunit